MSKMSIESTDQYWMQRALMLAEKGRGKVSPNPMVGAVIVKANEISGEEQVVGEGYHEVFGGPHAEVVAFSNCKASPKGATLYVTLEPCCHFGKTPPCTAAIIRAGIKRVVVGALDPNPLVSGKGVAQLKENGLTVAVGVEKQQCEALNKVFFHYIKQQKPYVILKSAMSLDGKIATRTGESKWITGEQARQHGHQVRGQVKALMVGIGTVMADNPLLTCRLENSSIQANPIRIVIDKYLELPMMSQLVQTARGTPVWVVTQMGNKQTEKSRYLEMAGVELLEAELDEKGHFDLNALMSYLAKREVDSLLIEGGASLNDSALRAGVVNEVHFYMSPQIIGGEQAKTAIGGLGFSKLSEALSLKEVSVETLGRDWLFRGLVETNTLGGRPCLQELLKK